MKLSVPKFLARMDNHYLVVCVVAFLVYFFARCISGIIDFCQWFRFVQDFLDYAETLCF